MVYDAELQACAELVRPTTVRTRHSSLSHTKHYFECLLWKFIILETIDVRTKLVIVGPLLSPLSISYSFRSAKPWILEAGHGRVHHSHIAVATAPSLFDPCQLLHKRTPTTSEVVSWPDIEVARYWTTVLSSRSKIEKR